MSLAVAVAQLALSEKRGVVIRGRGYYFYLSVITVNPRP